MGNKRNVLLQEDVFCEAWNILHAFCMYQVPVQRVTRYPLLLSRLLKVRVKRFSGHLKGQLRNIFHLLSKRNSSTVSQ
jgi:hypothetical protein